MLIWALDLCDVNGFIERNRCLIVVGMSIECLRCHWFY